MRTSDYIQRAILKYESEGGETRASSEASGLTSAKVQVRDANGNLLAEYDKADILKQTANTPNKGLKLLVAAFGGIATIAFVGVYVSQLPQNPSLWLEYIFNPQSIYNPPSTPSTTENGKGVESGGGGSGINRVFAGKSQRHYNVITGLSGLGTNNLDAYRQERYEGCLARVSDAISQEDFNRLLSEGAEVISQGDKTDTGLTYYGVGYTCFYVSYIVKQ